MMRGRGRWQTEGALVNCPGRGSGAPQTGRRLLPADAFSPELRHGGKGKAMEEEASRLNVRAPDSFQPREGRPGGATRCPAMAAAPRMPASFPRAASSTRVFRPRAGQVKAGR